GHVPAREAGHTAAGGSGGQDTAAGEAAHDRAEEGEEAGAAQNTLAAERVSRRTILLAVAVVGLAGCGSGDRSEGSHAPVTPAERAGVADFKYCLEGASVLTAPPGKTIPELGK